MPSCIVKPFQGDQKDRTQETIHTQLGSWQSHFELHSMSKDIKIGYFSCELGGHITTW